MTFKVVITKVNNSILSLRRKILTVFSVTTENFNGTIKAAPPPIEIP